MLWQTLLKALQTLAERARRAPPPREHIPFIPRCWKAEDFPLCSKSTHNVHERAQLNELIWHGQHRIH